MRAICLDVTRLCRRIGAGPHTGIDRVEYAYLNGLLEKSAPLYGLARTAAGYVLLGRDGLAGLKARIDGEVPLGPVDGIGRLSLRLPRTQRQVQADLRRLCIARTVPRGLGGMLTRRIDGPLAYLNVGHANLTPRVLQSVAGRAETTTLVMIHDTIPLDHPDWQRPGGAEAFGAKLAAVGQSADHVISVSADALQKVAGHLGPSAACAFHVVRPGLDPPASQSSAHLPSRDRPYLLTVGTIEPRKGSDMLLELWVELERALGPDQTPDLVLAGSRGWASETWHRAFDGHPMLGHRVHELPGQTDAQVAGLLAGCQALLHPSRAEGFGIPPHDAALAGRPVLVSDLAVYRETLGDKPVYLPRDDMYQWVRAIADVLNAGEVGQRATGRWATDPAELTWDRHLKTILSLLG